MGMRMSQTLNPDEFEQIRAAWYQRYLVDVAGQGVAWSSTIKPAPDIIAEAEQQASVATPPFAVRVLNRMAFGPALGDVAAFNALGANDDARLSAYVDQQLDWSAISDAALDSRLSNAGYQTLGKSLTQLWADHVIGDPAYSVRMRPAFETERAAFVRATFSKRQLREVMVDFWHNHFNVFSNDFSAGPVFVHYDRDVIRTSALGNFRTLLEDVAQSPSMLYFLDNYTNTRAGPNENWARELLELHTLGAENYLGFANPFEIPPDPDDPDYPRGYSDIDVYETSSAFTGWSLRNGHWEYPAENDGTFVYRQDWHDAGPKFVLGMLLYPEQPAMKDGRDIMDRLASHPGTARFICRKLVRRLVSDSPPSTLVNSAAAVFRASWQQPDQIAQTVRHILLSNEFKTSWGQKIKRPFEAVVSSMRILSMQPTVRVDHEWSDSFMWRFGFTGNKPFGWPAPNGYPDVRTSWSGSNALGMTWKVLNWLTESEADGSPSLAILQIALNSLGGPSLPTATASNLVTFFSNRVLGYQLDPQRKAVLVDFMAQNGDPDSFEIDLNSDSWSAGDLKNHYNQQRLRSMVSMLLMTPEFFSR
jgi:uncharacterized protein (DUF1800 family)